ncbi:sister chromatid cohesion 1 protein 2-like [Lotus japonicus]|uniref:sister chromatid cohesion 1 protein 2-like n=1 Tax=Lotus japonicus TaxID=34305 RepID=UPI002584FDC4|nr:sister chromatid cohesion 1 protein 2-like [Lotus japonicus]
MKKMSKSKSDKAASEMLNTKSLCSMRDPMWVAAYFYKKLKKAQVVDTDISSCIEKILQGEMDVTSYRVLAYLVLGVVRIYSKKVEYLLHDCNKVLSKFKEFVITTTKRNAHPETLHTFVTIPERFELDAFDLDILEDDGGDHIAPKEKITLKEVLSKTERSVQFSHDKFEDFDSGGSSSSAHNSLVEHFHRLMMGMDFEDSPPDSSINLVAGEEQLENSLFSRKEPMNFDSVLIVDETEKESINLSGEDQQMNEDQEVQEIVKCVDEIVQEIVKCVDGINKERSRISEEESTDISMFSEREKETVLSVEAFNESCEVDDDHIMAREMSSSSCQVHQEITQIHEARNFQESIGRSQDDISSQDEFVDHVTSSVAKESHEEVVGGSVEEHDRKGKLVFQKKVSFEDRTPTIPAQSKTLDVTPQSKFQGHSVGIPKPGTTTSDFMPIPTPAVREPGLLSRKRKSDKMTVLPNEETSSSSCQLHQEITQIHEARNFQESIGRPQDNISSQNECVDHIAFSVAKESQKEVVGGSTKEHGKEGKKCSQKNVSFEDGTPSSIPEQSKNLDVTPQSRFQGHSVGIPKPGTTTSDFIPISKRAVRKPGHLSRKRKPVIDKMTVLSDKVLKRSLIDTSDLISNRRQFRPTLLSKRRESCISSLPDGFNESFFPCFLQQLQSLFSKKMKISDSLEIVEPPERLDVSKSQTVGSPEHIETSLRTPPQGLDPLVTNETPGALDVSGCQTFDNPEHIATAPQTPPPCQNIQVRSVELPRRTEIQYSDNLGPSSPHANTEKEQPSNPDANTEREQPLEETEVPELVEKFNIESSDSYESVEQEQCSTKDDELNLINEEINSCETENSKLEAGWSARTRKFASHLHRVFQDQGKQKEGDDVNFSEVVGGRDRKESARMFYELLVLKTTNYVNVKQDKAYEDIAVSKLPKFDQTFGADGN